MKLFLHPRHEVVERHVNIMSKAASQITLLEKTKTYKKASTNYNTYLKRSIDMGCTQISINFVKFSLRSLLYANSFPKHTFN